MLSCINEIQNFVFETIDDEWEQFKSEIHRATSIETVTDAHMSFLESITKFVNDEFVVSNTTIVWLKSLENLWYLREHIHFSYIFTRWLHFCAISYNYIIT